MLLKESVIKLKTVKSTLHWPNIGFMNIMRMVTLKVQMKMARGIV